MSLPVYLIEYLGFPRNHHALFICLNEKQQDGVIFHVVGDVQKGMSFETKPGKRPEESNSYVGKTLLGSISSSDLNRFRDICQSNPPPPKQFNGSKRIDPTKPLRRCQEWTSETVKMLENRRVLTRHSGGGTASYISGASSGQLGHSSNLSSQAVSSLGKQPVEGQKSSDGYWTWSSKYGDWYHVGKDGCTLLSKQQGSRSSGQGRR